jgi:hypothetical protein
MNQKGSVEPTHKMIDEEKVIKLKSWRRLICRKSSTVTSGNIFRPSGEQLCAEGK